MGKNPRKPWRRLYALCLLSELLVGGWFLFMFTFLLISKVWNWLAEGRVSKRGKANTLIALLMAGPG